MARRPPSPLECRPVRARASCEPCGLPGRPSGVRPVLLYTVWGPPTARASSDYVQEGAPPWAASCRHPTLVAGSRRAGGCSCRAPPTAAHQPALVSSCAAVCVPSFRLHAPHRRRHRLSLGRAHSFRRLGVLVGPPPDVGPVSRTRVSSRVTMLALHATRSLAAAHQGLKVPMALVRMLADDCSPPSFQQLGAPRTWPGPDPHPRPLL